MKTMIYAMDTSIFFSPFVFFDRMNPPTDTFKIDKFTRQLYILWNTLHYLFFISFFFFIFSWFSSFCLFYIFLHFQEIFLNSYVGQPYSRPFAIIFGRQLWLWGSPPNVLHERTNEREREKLYLIP